ncbi:MAG TPA: hypothetical protein VL357_04445 [Rariglobus sp.]|jgi:hypothetical protein|nr:hypothetical protein [Rariglobus sp.]
MAAKSQEKIIFGAALLVLLSSATWLVLQQSKIAALRKAPASVGAGAAYVPAGIDAPKVSTSTWPTPPAQTRGPDWIYDVFTPPEIYYNTSTKEFSVTPPAGPEAVKVVEIPFGLDMVQVKPDVFRLQLVGYVGNAGAYQGTFENTVTGDTFLAKAGKKITSLGLTIRDFEVKRNRVPAPDSMPIYETVATAVVVDDKTGDEVTLTNKERRTKGTPIAVLKSAEGDQLFEQKAGTSFMVGTVKYTVNSVTLDPASAEVTKESPDLKEPVTKTLLVPVPTVAPVSPATPEAPKPDQASPTPAPSIAFP